MHGGQSGSYVKSGSGRSSRGSTWRERRQKGCEDREYKEQGQSGLGEGSFQTYRTTSSVSRRNHFDKKDEELERRDEELEHLRRLVRDLELEVRVGVREGTMRSEEKGRLVWGVTMEQGPINPDLIGTEIACGNIQTGIRFPWRNDDLEMLSWTL